MSTDIKKGSILSASLLLAAWCIGNAFFALPIASGSSGFFPSMSVNLIVFLLTTVSSLLYAEAILALTDGDNIISLCKKLIGPITTILITLLFLFLHYSWLASYFHDLLPIISEIIPFLSLTGSGFLFLMLLIIIVFCGLQTTNRFNYFFFTGLILSTLLLAFLLIHDISLENLLRNEWAFVFLTIPTYIGFYYYQSILPTLSTYLHRDHIKIRKAILLGTIIILLFNTLWQLLIIGILPESLLWKTADTLSISQQGIQLFKGSPFLTNIYNFVLFFSITTSLMIEGCILVDVFSDGLHIPIEKRTGYKRFLLCLIIFVPSALLSTFDWIIAEDAISGWGELILIGPLPALLVWQLRYTHHLPAPRLLPGGRTTLVLFALLSFLLFYIQGANLLWSST